MMSSYVRFAPLTMMLIITMLLTSWPPTNLSARPLPVPQVQQTITPAECSRLATQRQIYLPLIVNSGRVMSTTTTAPPLASTVTDSDFVIISPADGITVAGTTVFAIQPAGNANIACASFRAGNIDLGMDLTPDDGLQVFLDASMLPPGTNTLTAQAVGASGHVTTKSIRITNVPNPPASAAIGPDGATLATESGGTIIVPPGAISGSATVQVRDRTQQQVTANTGIDWDGLGVTFLGAMEVTSDQPFNRPLGVSSVGFSNRIQPGQVVVTYNLLPDQDGDGIGELVVVNGADVAPNGTIVSPPVSGIIIESIAVEQSGAALAQTDAISGPPGTLIQIRGRGFNVLASVGNTAIFQSTVDGSMIELPGVVQTDPANPAHQIFEVLIPPLPAGAATLVLRNASTGETTESLALTITASAPLSRPAEQIINDFFVNTLPILEALPGETPEQEAQRDALIASHIQQQERFSALASDPSPEAQQILTNIAIMLTNAPDLGATLAANIAQRCFPPGNRRIAERVVLYAGVISGLLCFVIGAAATPLAGAICGAAVAIYYGELNYFVTDTPDCSNDSRPQCPAAKVVGVVVAVLLWVWDRLPRPVATAVAMLRVVAMGL